MEVVAHGVVDEAAALLLGFARLILEDHVVIPPALHGKAAAAAAAAHARRVEQRVALQDGAVPLLELVLGLLLLLPSSPRHT